MAKYDVFISYSRKDFEEVKSFKEMLESRIPGINIWFDVNGVESGDEFEEKIITAIDNSAQVLFFLSKNSNASKWAKDELMYAKNTGKKVVPILLKGVTLKGWFLFKFGRIDCIDSNNKIQVEKLIYGLGPSPIPKPSVPIDTDNNNQKKASKKKSILYGVLAIPGALILYITMIFLLGFWDAVFSSDNAESDDYIPGSMKKQDNTLVLADTAVCIDSEAEEIQINGHDAVDLGLSVKWATCNIGANSPEEYGDYYAWGETSTKFFYTKDNSATENIKVSEMSGDATYDVARAQWGWTWRLPTESEIVELDKCCTWVWTNQGGHNGYRVTGPNGNFIFLPAAGYRNESSLSRAGSDGTYWSSTPHESDSSYSYDLNFYSSSPRRDYYRRYHGHGVRPVSE